MGLALGVDYSLFVVSRFREERARGVEKIEAIAATGRTASRAVLFSGTAFVIALTGMLLVPDTILRSLAAGAILVGLTAVAAATTLLPAVLSLLGDRVDSLRLPFVGRGSGEAPVLGRRRRPRAAAAARPPARLDRVPRRCSRCRRSSCGRARRACARSRTATRRRTASTRSSASSASARSTRRRSSSRETWPPRPCARGSSGCARSSPPTGRSGTRSSRPRRTGRSPWSRRSWPATAATSAPCRRSSGCGRSSCRRRSAHAGVDVYVTGETAEIVDYRELMERWLPIVFAFVLGFSFILLTVAFRSIVVPAKAIVLNLLSVGAAYGLIVLVFQEGVGNELLRLPAGGRDRGLAAALPLLRPLRALDGLPRLPAQPDPRALHADRRLERGGRVRRPHDRTADHRRGADHHRRLRRASRPATS